MPSDKNKKPFLLSWKSTALATAAFIFGLVALAILLNRSFEDFNKVLEEERERQAREDEAWCRERFKKEVKVNECLLRLRESR